MFQFLFIVNIVNITFMIVWRHIIHKTMTEAQLINFPFQWAEQWRRGEEAREEE